MKRINIHNWFSDLSKSRKLVILLLVVSLFLTAGLVVNNQKVQAHFNYAWGGGVNWGPPGACPSSSGPLQTGWYTAPTTPNFTITQGTASVSTQVGAQVHVCALSTDCVGGPPHFDFYNIDGRISGMPGQTSFPNLCPGQEATNTWTITINTSAMGVGLNEACYQWTGWGWYFSSGWQSVGDWQCYHIQVNAAPPPVKPTVSAVCNGLTSQLNISWAGSSTGSFGSFSVDVSAPNNSSHTANNYYSKGVGTATSTTAPSGFNLWPGGTPAMPALVPGATYWVWVWNGALSPISSPVVAKNCTPVVTCGSMITSVTNPGPNQSFTVKVSFNNGAGTSANITTASYTMRLTIVGNTSGPTYSNTAVTFTPSTVTPGSSGSFTTPLISYATTGRYDVTMTLTGPGVALTCTSGGGSPTFPPIVVSAKPYLRIYSGDVVAGSGFAPSSCTPNASAGIISWNNSAAGNFSGAGVQFAAQAMSSITEFASADLRANPPSALGTPNPGKGLTFANNAADTFGGNFGAAPCAQDYFGNISAAATPGPATYAGNPSLSGKTVLKYDGDVVISNNVVYAGGAWTTATVPSLYLVVRGNIYIANTVTNLDGVYIAIPTNPASPTNGRIYTCSSGFAPMTINTSYFANCNFPLTVNGAFVASRVVFGRTSGDILTAPANEARTSANIAEKLIYSPEIWLTGGPSSSNTIIYDSITGLPPVL